MSKGRLEGRRIVITGGGQGIGRGTARRFIEEGAEVALFDLNATTVAEAAAELGPKAHGYAVDVTDPAALAEVSARAAEAMGGIDGVITAAGIMWRGRVEEVPPEDWRHVIEVNLSGSYYTIQAALPFLRKAKGATVVLVSSAMGLRPDQPGRTAYAASKGGVVNLARAFAAEFAPEIRANCVCPGLVDTPMADGVRGNFGNYALGRLATAEELANVLLFLTSDEASYVTGAVWAADGGRSYH